MNSYGEDNRFFFLCLISIFIVLIIIIYVSVTSSPKEEFVEIYWQVFEIKNLENTIKVNCLGACTLSGVYRIGDVEINGITYSVIIIDPYEAGVYSNLCIDTDNDEIYCEGGEGPFEFQGTFFIGPNAFNVMNFYEDNVIIAHYPKLTENEKNTVGFALKSYYKKTTDFNVSLHVNESLKKSEILAINPQEEIILKYIVSLPEVGLSKIKISVSPVSTKEEAYIDFWVNRI
jgi:hypothetical protein